MQLITNKNNKAIVFVHGILETNKQFIDFEEKFNNYDIYMITLPGHSGSPLNFGRSSLAKWQDKVEKEILAIKDCYKTIIGIGHSMGGLLLLDFSYKYPNIINKIICLAIPLKIKPRIKGMLNSLAIAFKLYKKDNSYMKEKREYYALDQSRNILLYYRFIMRFLDLFKLSRRVRKEIFKINSKILIINSKNDEMVSAKIAKYETNNIKIYYLNKSQHTIYVHDERIFILDLVASFIIM